MNKNVFSNYPGRILPNTNTVNEAGGIAYKLEPKAQLAQYVCTGCINNTYYANATDQPDRVIKLCESTDDNFIAKLAIYARQRGFMKDMPALLVAVLAAKAKKTNNYVYFDKAFGSVIDNAKMLRNFIQTVRSGVVGRKSFGTHIKRSIQKWVLGRTPQQLLNDSVGNDPSLADILKMIHPKPISKEQEKLFRYFIGKEFSLDELPQNIKEFELFKSGFSTKVPNVDFRLLSAIPNLSKEIWTEIAKNMPWNALRMNLNSLERHGVFESKDMVNLVAKKLKDAELIKRTKVFPYQIMTSYNFASKGLTPIANALQDALDASIENVPLINGNVIVCLDVSGSMSSPVTGSRSGSTSVVRCVDVASLMAACLVKKNLDTIVVPFSDSVVPHNINFRDSVATISAALSSLPVGGTNCSSAIQHVNTNKLRADLVIFISDNESWLDNNRRGYTKVMQQWSVFKKNNPRAKMVCIDLQPYGSTQAKESNDIMNIGGFSDTVFEIIKLFAENKLGTDHWVSEIEKVDLA